MKSREHGLAVCQREGVFTRSYALALCWFT